MTVAETPEAEAGLAFARLLRAFVMAAGMRYRVATEPEVIPGGTDAVQMALVTETGDRVRVEVEFAGNEWETAVDREFVEWFERDLHPFGPVDLSIPGPTIDAVCGECGLVIATDLTGECPECLAPTNKEDER